MPAKVIPWRLVRALPAPALALGLLACSLISLDGFSGGAVDDGGIGASDAPSLDGPPADPEAGMDAGIDAATDGGEAGPGAYALAVLADAPLAYFRLADPPGTASLKNEIASSALSMVAPTTGVRLGVAGIAGAPDTALALDSSDVPVTVASFELASTPELFSVEAWVRVDMRGNGEVFEDWDNGGTTALRNGTALFLTSNNELRSEMWLTGTHKSYTNQTTAIVLGRFMHVVFLHSDRDHLYVDGAEAPGQDLNGGGARTMTLAAFHFQGFIGVLDEVAFYGTALPAARILAHYAAGAQK